MRIFLSLTLTMLFIFGKCIQSTDVGEGRTQLQYRLFGDRFIKKRTIQFASSNVHAHQDTEGSSDLRTVPSEDRVPLS